MLAAAESSPGADVAAQLRDAAAMLDANAGEVDAGERLGDATPSTLAGAGDAGAGGDDGLGGARPLPKASRWLTTPEERISRP